MRTDTPAFRMADRLAGGNLEAVICEQRDAGRSLEAIARHLHAEYGIEVTRQTIANWLTDRTPEPAEAAS